MGISGLWSFYSNLIKKVNIDDIKGKVAFIDIILYFSRYIISIK